MRLGHGCFSVTSTWVHVLYMLNQSLFSSMGPLSLPRRIATMYHFFFTTATLISYLPCVYASGNAPSALTSSGQIIGHAAFNRSSVGEFLGIKYAVAPVGDLRFAPPRRYKAPAGEVYNADNWVSGSPLACC